MKINFQSPSSGVSTVEVFGGLTLMEAAVQGGIEQIEAECGGACACATCHVYIPDAWRAVVGEASEMESDLLEIVDNRKPNSRLACQIDVTAEMDGITVDLPR